MRIFTNLTAFMLAFLFATTGLAQTNGILKIGVVDINRLFSESPQFQEARAKLEDEFAPRQREIIAMQTALGEKAKKLEKDISVMGESEREAAQRELRNSERDIARAQNEFREDAQVRENEFLQQVQQNVLQEIIVYGQEQGYDIILPAGPGGAVFASPKVDVTAPLIERLKAKSSGS